MSLDSSLQKIEFSIITICRNEGTRILPTIESVQSQQYSNYEHIIVDGASTDNTLDSIRQAGHKGPLISEKDRGIYDAQNKGAQIAKGRYLLFLNAGDVLASPETLKIVSGVAKEKKFALIYGNIDFIDSNGLRTTGLSQAPMSWKFLENSTYFHPSTYILKDHFFSVGPYDIRYKLVADYDFFVRSFKKITLDEIAFIPEVLSVFKTDGVSSLPKNWSLLQQERALVQLRQFPPFLALKILIPRLIGKTMRALNLKR